MRLLVKNARAVVGPDVIAADVLCEDGVIVRVDRDIPAGDARVIDADGNYLLPGGVDVHTHFDLDLGAVRATDDFQTGTIAAACGGTTTIVDHIAFGPPGCRLGHQIDVYHRLAANAVVDYSFHGVIGHVDDTVLEDMEKLIADGITSYKVYLTYGGKLGDSDLLRVLERARQLGLIICAHCENDAMIAHLTQRLLAAGVREPHGHPLSRPPASEAEAVYRMASFAAATGDAPLYIVHLSSALGLEVVQAARRHGQRRLFAETCPQYLFLDDSRYDDPVEGLKFIMAPPLRKRMDNEMLWQGLREGDIDAVATDHCPFFFSKEKQRGRDDFTRCPGGIPGVEARLSLLFSEGFMRGRLPLPDVARLCATNPARIFGLYPKKGVIQPGSDADLVLFDPNITRTINHDHLHERVDYTPYEGMEVRGAPVVTISRGEVVAEGGAFVGEVGRGRFVKRGLPDLSVR
ncbi:MAG: dihydropyrimidinase [Planctomycetaceae bacterium]|nr:dihydropyrimidinase [Planctomycetaceae bacterium]